MFPNNAIVKYIEREYYNYIDIKERIEKNAIPILMMSAKLITFGLLKVTIFRKVRTSQYKSMASSRKFYHVTQIILLLWSLQGKLQGKNW